MVQLGNLKQIFVENTPLQVPKLVTAERGVKAIQEFFNDQIQLQKQIKKQSREEDAAILIKAGGGKPLDMNESSDDDDEDSVNIISSHESEHDEDSDNDMRWFGNEESKGVKGFQNKALKKKETIKESHNLMEGVSREFAEAVLVKVRSMKHSGYASSN